MGLLGPRDSEDRQSVAAKNDVPIRLLFVFQLLSSAAEGAAAADAAEPWPSLGMSCFFLKKKLIKSESKEPSPPPRAVSSVAFRLSAGYAARSGAS